MSGLLNKLKKNKTPEQLVAAMVEALDQGQDAQLAKRLSQIKFVLYGEEERDPDEARCVERELAAARAASSTAQHSSPCRPFCTLAATSLLCLWGHGIEVENHARG